MNRKTGPTYTLCALIATTLVLVACGRRTSHSKAGEKPTITVTIEPQRFLAEAIAGDRFSIVSMVPKGTSPETYDPIPQQLVALDRSRAYLRIGYIGFEQVWMERIAANVPHMQMFDTSQGIDFITGSPCYHEGHHQHHHHHDIEPHVWNSATNALILATNTYKALAAIDPAGEPYYRHRHDSLALRIQRIDSLVRRRLETPGADRAFMIYHPALSYFARDYGLTQIAIEEGGKEPSPAYLRQLIDRCRREQVRVIFVQPEFDRRNAETIAQQTGTQVVPINPLSYDWEEEMLRVAAALTPAAGR